MAAVHLSLRIDLIVVVARVDHADPEAEPQGVTDLPIRERVAFYREAERRGWLTPDEIRAIEGLPPLDSDPIETSAFRPLAPSPALAELTHDAAGLRTDRDRTASTVTSINVLESGEGYVGLARVGDETFRLAKSIANAPASIGHLLGRVIWTDGETVYCYRSVIGRRDDRGRVEFVPDREFRAALGLDRPS